MKKKGKTKMTTVTSDKEKKTTKRKKTRRRQSTNPFDVKMPSFKMPNF